MKRGRAFAILFGAVALLALLLTGCGHSAVVTTLPDQPGAASSVRLVDLHAVSDLQARFEQDAGKPRLVLLVSPT